MANANDNANAGRKGAKNRRFDPNGWFDTFDAQGNPVELPKEFRVIRKKINFSEIKYAVQHDEQSKYGGYDIKKRLGAITISISKAEKKECDTPVYSGDDAWLNEDITFIPYEIYIYLDEAMRDCPLSVKLQAPPQNFIGTILVVKAKNVDQQIHIKSKVTCLVSFCMCCMYTQFFCFVLYVLDRLQMLN